MLDALAPRSDAEAGASNTFHELVDKAFPSLQTAEAKDRLAKWNLDQYTVTKVFRFEQPFVPEQIDAFLLDFFNSPTVQDAAPVCCGPGANSWGKLGALSPGSVKYRRLTATILRLDFFDRLKEEGIVRSGDIAKCFDVQCGEILVSDRLRKMLLDESSEEWELFSEAERNELIFHVLRRLAVGGGMNQYDDEIEPYLTATRGLYKDLVTVSKTAGGALQVGSFTYSVASASGSSASLFPRPSSHNFCYVTIDPLSRHVKLWYSAWFPMM